MFQRIGLFCQLICVAPPLLLWQCLRHPIKALLWFATLKEGFVLLRITLLLSTIALTLWVIGKPLSGVWAVVSGSLAVSIYYVMFTKTSVQTAVAMHAQCPFPMSPYLWNLWCRLFFPAADQPAPQPYGIPPMQTDHVRFHEPIMRPFSVAEAKAALPDHLKALIDG